MAFNLKPFSIGDVEVASPVVLAALAGYSDMAYRLICRRLGAPFCATEMLLDQSISLSGRLQRRLLNICEEDHPIAGQLIGNDPADMAHAAGLLCRSGFDVIDLNYACPMRKALSRSRGGAIMDDPVRANSITKAVAASIDRPLMLKLRSSFHQDNSSRDNFWRIAEGAFDAGAAAICVHGRSVEARYRGPADWDFMAEVKKHFADKTILVSGDARSPAAALDLLKQTGADGVAAARGALGNPWFFRQMADVAAGREAYQPSLAEQRQVLIDHFAMACELYGPERGSRNMRKHGIKYSHIHPQPKKVRMAFVEVSCPADWHTVLDEFY